MNVSLTSVLVHTVAIAVCFSYDDLIEKLYYIVTILLCFKLTWEWGTNSAISNTNWSKGHLFRSPKHQQVQTPSQRTQHTIWLLLLRALDRTVPTLASGARSSTLWSEFQFGTNFVSDPDPSHPTGAAQQLFTSSSIQRGKVPLPSQTALDLTETNCRHHRHRHHRRLQKQPKLA